MILWSRASSGHRGIRITAGSSLDISGPIGGYGKDWCSARGLGGGAASDILWKIEYIKVGNTAFRKLWIEIAWFNGTFEVCELSLLLPSSLLLACPPPFLPSNYLRFKPLLYSPSCSTAPPDTCKPSFLHADLCFYPHTPSACSAPPPYFRGHTGSLLSCLLAGAARASSWPVGWVCSRRVSFREAAAVSDKRAPAPREDGNTDEELCDYC